VTLEHRTASVEETLIMGCCRSFPKCGGCFAVIARRFCCSFCWVKPEKRVILLGKKGCGKTSLLYNMHSNLPFSSKKLPTRGYNYEVISFSPFKTYEFVDPGGSEIQSNMWTVFTDSVSFNYIVYVIDMSGYLNLDPEQRQGYFKEDRKNLRLILANQKNNKNKIQARLIVYMNSRSETKEDSKGEVGAKLLDKKAMLRALLMDELQLHHDDSKPDNLWIPSENFCDRVEDRQTYGEEGLKSRTLLSLLDVGSDDVWEAYCYPDWVNYFH